MKIAVILASGIGNAILFSPALIEMQKMLPKPKIDLLVFNESYAEPFRGSNLYSNIIKIPNNSILTLLFVIKNRNKYEISITAFPSNRWEFNLFAFLLGANKRITHKYFFGKMRTFSFLQNSKVLANPKLHDIEQNMNLLSKLGIKHNQGANKPFFFLSKQDYDFALRFLKENNITKKMHILGVHAGAGDIGVKKKWGIENFANEINTYMMKHKNGVVILFGGVEEFSERNRLKKLVVSRTIIFTGPLKNSAALISKCNYFLSNDTGLMHIASAFQIPQKAIFISTSCTRTAPRNINASILKLGNKTPFKYPFWSVKP